MKAKLNFDTAKLKDFAIQHTEKVVFGIFGLTLLYFAYSGFLHETYDKTPSELNNLITSARNHITTSDPPAKVNDTELPVVDIEQNLAPKELTAFATSELVRPNIRDLGSKRGNPVILPPADLHVSADNGTVRLEDPPKNPMPADNGKEVDTRAVAWAVITGIVPLQAQIDEYNEAFAAAIEQKSGDDEPQYIFHQVQRQEIGSNESVGPWEDVSTTGVKRLIKKWTAGNQRNTDVISSDYLRGAVCLALPPILGHTFGDEVAHPDLINRKEEPEEEEPEEAKPEPDLDQDLPDLPAEERKKKPAVNTKSEEEVDLEQKLLFRFFDFTAMPGKTYRYRGRVWVTNPNLDIETRHLAEQNFVFEGKSLVTNKEKYLKSSWGSASPPVTIPFFSTLFAGEFSEGGSREDSMMMPLAVLDPKTGYELLDTIQLHRGQFANFKDASPLVIKPSNNRGGVERVEDTELNTDHFVLDFLPQDTSGEHHAVVMGPDLKLRVVHESEKLSTRIADLDAANADNDSSSDRDSNDDPFGNIQLKPGRRGGR